METYKEDNQRMDELFRKAREEKPLMHLDEVKNVLPASQPVIPHSKGFHFSMSHIIVVSGIVISSGLAYLTIKKDKTDNIPQTEQVSQAPVQSIKPENPVISTTTTPSTPSNNNNPVASTDKKLIIPPVEKHKKVSLNDEYVPSEQFTVKPKFTHDGKHYVVTVIGTKVVDVVVDGVSISSEEYLQHTEAIEKAKGYAEARIKEEGDKQFLINFFDKQLRSDKIAANENRYTFQLTDSQLLIDGIEQSSEMYEKYSRLFKQQTGKEVAKGDEYQYKMSRKQLVNKETLVGKIKEEQ